jgi:hypothetical protein
MPIVKQSIGEIDVVELLETVDGWPAGTSGTVVHDFGVVKTIEISNDRGETLALPSVPTEDLKLLVKYGD